MSNDKDPKDKPKDEEKPDKGKPVTTQDGEPSGGGNPPPPGGGGEGGETSGGGKNG